MEKGQDWKWQVVDSLDEFAQDTDPGREQSTQLLLEDDGQINLVIDALKQVFPTSRFRRGDELTALELGRIFGHWCYLWETLISSQTYLAALIEAHAETVNLRDKIDSILAEHLPEAMKGIETGIFHLLAEMNDPAFITSARGRKREFQALRTAVFQLANYQQPSERDPFLKGFGEAIASCPLDENGLPNNPGKLQTLLAVVRPYAVRGGLSSSDFQHAIDELNGSMITGHYDGFAKHLQRRNASLRGKGRPLKKWASVPKSK